MAKRSKALNDILTTANAVLAQKSVFVGNHYADGRSEEGIAFKQGVINMIETVLHASKSYKGYMYIGPDAIEASCERMYF